MRALPRSCRRAVAVVVAVTALLAAAGAVGAAPASPLVVVVSSESPVTEISRLHLSDIYLGRASRLPDGGRVEPIDQEPTSDIWATFYATYLGRTPAQVKAHWSKIIFTGRGTPPRHAASSEAVKELVAGDPRAIGYIERSRVDASVRVVRVK